MKEPIAQTLANSDPKSQEPELPTFMDHLRELRGRFFWVALFFMAISGATYPFFNQIVGLLLKPLGHQELYYLTPAGGISFIIKICMYVGFIGTLPLIIYHLYKFISPIMDSRNSHRAVRYTFLSTALAIIGVVFAYTVSLPAAVHFLTNFGITGVNAMLTADSYLSFITAYLLSGAILFQMPLIIIIIDSIKPLSPKKLFGFERYLIVIAFVVAALLSPTPDVVNQTILAAPIIIMYQLGIALVWWRHRVKGERLSENAEVAAKPVMAKSSILVANQVISPNLPPRTSARSMEFVNDQSLVKRKKTSNQSHVGHTTEPALKSPSATVRARVVHRNTPTLRATAPRSNLSVRERTSASTPFYSTRKVSGVDGIFG